MVAGGESGLRGAWAEAGPASALPAGAEDRLVALIERARRAHPELSIDGARFVTALARVAGDDAAATLRELHAEDFGLAVACAAGVPGAVERCDRLCAPAIAAAIARVDTAADFRDEVRQILWQRLFVGADGRPPRIASYGGRGPLAAWVAVAAQRVALDLRRAAGRAPAADPDADQLLPAREHPEADYLRTRYRGEFEAGVRAALAALGRRDRLLLRLTTVSGLSHEQIAAIYSVNQSTVSRWIARARADVLAAAEREVCARLQLPLAEFRSLAGLFLSDLDLSVSRILESRPDDDG
ncbi:MAG TPA: sigma-70 family RNA polymerase sigma factor [Polyangia bacterium]|nr:sigma-70 family RNA polymerase sigma factor [Polyangia bacterium]